MTHAIRAGSGWALLPYGEDVTYQGVTASYATVMLWSDDEREAFGVYVVPEPDAAPEGQMETSRTLVSRSKRPVWSVSYQPAPDPKPPTAPDNPTLGDWRVGLVLWKTPGGNRRDEVLAKIKALLDAGHPLGPVADERVNYSNNVLRADLLALKDAVGFSVEDIEESLWRAAQVQAGDLSGVWPLPNDKDTP